MNMVWLTGYELDGRYKIIQRLALTDRCEVYLAEELTALRHTVVIKRLKPERVQDLETRERFVREATVLRRVHHHTVLPIYDIKLGDDDYYFVTAFATRGSLQEYLTHQPNHKLDLLEALDIAIGVCEGLDVAHKCGIVHRDVKPGNVLLFDNADGVVARLGDFSIASVLSERALTIKDTQLCTPLYAAPEQLTGDLVDARSDLYSWGTTFFEMLTGETPDRSLKPPVAAVYYPALPEFPLAFFVERGVPLSLAPVLQRALRTDRTKRYQSAAEVLEDLNRTKAIITAPQDPSTTTQAIKVDPGWVLKWQGQLLWEGLGNWFSRHRRMTITSTAMALFVCAGLTIGTALFSAATPTPTPTPPSAPTPQVLVTVLPITVTVVLTPTFMPTVLSTPTQIPPTTQPTPISMPSPTAPPSLATVPALRPTPTDIILPATATATPTPVLAAAVRLREPQPNQARDGDSIFFEWFASPNQQPTYSYNVYVRLKGSEIWKIACAKVNVISCVYRTPDKPRAEYEWMVVLVDAQNQVVTYDSEIRSFFWDARPEFTTPEPTPPRPGG
jgi:serine/threonine protein kinase